MKSAGPRTAAGKQKVRLNALRHGLFSSDIVLPGEDRDAYELPGRCCSIPTSRRMTYERDLVQTIHDTDRQLKRIRSLESSAHALDITREFDNADTDLEPTVRRVFAAALAYANPRLFDQFNRHSGRLTRLRDHTRKELIEFQIDRMKSETPAQQPAMAKVPPRPIENSPHEF